jgi:hypothetical protein
MQTKKFFALAAGAALLVNAAFMTAAYAMSTTGEVGVTVGGLSINDAPSSENFGSMSVATVDQYIDDYVFGGDVEFEDTRDSGAAYTVSVTATDFDDGVGNYIPVGQLSMGGNLLDDASGGMTDCTTGLTMEAMTLFADDDFDGTSASQPLVQADGTQATITHCAVTPEIDLTIPAYTPMGSYQSTITFTIA